MHNNLTNWSIVNPYNILFTDGILHLFVGCIFKNTIRGMLWIRIKKVNSYQFLKRVLIPSIKTVFVWGPQFQVGCWMSMILNVFTNGFRWPWSIKEITFVIFSDLLSPIPFAKHLLISFLCIRSYKKDFWAMLIGLSHCDLKKIFLPNDH